MSIGCGARGLILPQRRHPLPRIRHFGEGGIGDLHLDLIVGQIQLKELDEVGSKDSMGVLDGLVKREGAV